MDESVQNFIRLIGQVDRFPCQIVLTDINTDVRNFTSKEYIIYTYEYKEFLYVQEVVTLFSCKIQH